MDVDLRPWGWAPGNYVIRCCDCPEVSLGDMFRAKVPFGAKRSWRCEKHAREAMEARIDPATEAAFQAGAEAHAKTGVTPELARIMRLHHESQRPAFQREERYIVIKRRDLNKTQEAAIRGTLNRMNIDTVECVVVESDWPEHEKVWEMIEARAG